MSQDHPYRAQPAKAFWRQTVPGGDGRDIGEWYTRKWPIDEARVAFNQKGDAVRILIRVNEGPLVRVAGLSLRGVEGGWRREILSSAPIKRGEPLSSSALLNERVQVIDFFSAREIAEPEPAPAKCRCRNCGADLWHITAAGEVCCADCDAVCPLRLQLKNEN